MWVLHCRALERDVRPIVSTAVLGRSGAANARRVCASCDLQKLQNTQRLEYSELLFIRKMLRCDEQSSGDHLSTCGTSTTFGYCKELSMSSMSKYLEAKILGHITHKAEYPMPEPWLALCTAVPTSSSTGSTIAEATYTGYRRVKVSGPAWHAAVEGAPSVIKTAEAVRFAACTAGSSVIKAVALCDAETTGNMLW
jgi:hypothetical protein